VCAKGEVIAITAADIGARLVCVDADGKTCAWRRPDGDSRPTSARAQARRRARETQARALAAAMADRLFEAMRGGAPKLGETGLFAPRSPAWRGRIDEVTFSAASPNISSGGKNRAFGDLGALLGEEIRKRVDDWGVRLEKPTEGIRATVIGASQYTTQVSGSTIFVSPLGTLPLRNIR